MSFLHSQKKKKKKKGKTFFFSFLFLRNPKVPFLRFLPKLFFFKKKILVFSFNTKTFFSKKCPDITVCEVVATMGDGADVSQGG